MNRALRAATVGVLLLSPVALSACSAGQVTQTATQERDKVGAMAQVGDITLRAAELEYPRGGSYEAGDDAELMLAIVNGGQEGDTLLEVDGEGFGGVEIETAGTATTVGSASGGAADSEEIEIPADGTVFVDGDDTSITLTDLDDSLTVGEYLELTLTFEDAGEVTLPVTVANPDEAQDRGEAFDFHHEEEAEEESGEEAARERESAGESADDSGAGNEGGE
ncbi:copper(I)-binding protein [Blastococcus colisei]|uniref:Copper(I)-binding protein n=1 Tax=Blastococcus colisei TaxID=1564162 RepID=A0A543P0V7_9ACTN|nr:copper chaperone PCu(A)C [Blastococcus colisei]TQN37709.1 copper(I)-binding protein [Blastococcus colisei]